MDNSKLNNNDGQDNNDKERLYFTSFHELMTLRVAEILLVSSPYDAFIMQEDGRLSERIIHEYRGLNLTRPPRLTWISNAGEALKELEKRDYDVVIVMPHISDMDAYELCGAIKERFKEIAVYYFAYDVRTLLENEKWLRQNKKRLMETKKCCDRSIIDRIFIWSGNTDLLMALVKSREDFMNVDHDTQLADVRVIIVVEDSPLYLSSLLPYIYKEVVMQTQAVMDDSLNENDRILRMRARPKILVAENYEDAKHLYQKYKKYLLCVISDVRYPRGGKEDPEAGIRLLSEIHKDIPDIPLLMLSSEIGNKKKAELIPAFFLDKNSPSLHADIRYFLVHYLGFGDFLFRLNDGTVVARASNLRSMSTILHSVPGESIAYHANRNDFSKWLMARFEMHLASQIRPLKLSDFSTTRHLKEHIRTLIRNKLKIRQKGLVSDFIKEEFDPESDFVKIGRGSLGGKARGLAFIANLLREQSGFQEKFPDVDITLPKTVVITTEGFDDFESLNNTREFLNNRILLNNDLSDQEITEHFKKSDFPEWISHDLKTYLKHVKFPLAVRSSAILEDAHYRPSAGAYKTYMLPNNHPELKVRLRQLIEAIKLVYASIYQEAPRVLAKNSVYRPEEDKMAVIIQQLSGTENGHYLSETLSKTENGHYLSETLSETETLSKTESGYYFYPSISGVAQSWNFYPVSYMKPDEGVAHIALGLGKIVVDGGVALRFSPKYTEFLPQFSSVDNILKNFQRYFYALKIKTDDKSYSETTNFQLRNECQLTSDQLTSDHNAKMDYESCTDFELTKLDVDSAIDHAAVRKLVSTYIPEDNRIRDFFTPNGYPVLTFAPVLKFKEFPLGEILSELLEIGKNGMGCPVEIEFAVNLFDLDKNSGLNKASGLDKASGFGKSSDVGKSNLRKPEFCLLQIRPMMVARQSMDVSITKSDIDNAFCYSDKAMGSSQITEIYHIIYVKPDSFDTSKTVDIAEEISKLNSLFDKEATNDKYLLIGSGRWGTTDRWLGIPIKWNNITHVGTIIETVSDKLNADPSQGSHFFHNITSLGINYLGVPSNDNNFIDWLWLNGLPAEAETKFLRYIKFSEPVILKINGKISSAVILKQAKQAKINSER